MTFDRCCSINSLILRTKKYIYLPEHIFHQMKTTKNINMSILCSKFPLNKFWDIQVKFIMSSKGLAYIYNTCIHTCKIIKTLFERTNLSQDSWKWLHHVARYWHTVWYAICIYCKLYTQTITLICIFTLFQVEVDIELVYYLCIWCSPGEGVLI